MSKNNDNKIRTKPKPNKNKPVNKKTTIGLNMIVKNEAHVIINTLTNLCSKVVFDYWVICDTGSTDNTKELIKEFFENKKIEGELHENEWLNFGHNRTLALDAAFNKTDFLFIFDADDEIVGNFVFPENMDECDSYMVKYGKSLVYKRKQIVNNKKKWKYCGVLHEYIECVDKENKVGEINSEYYIISGKTGNRSQDPQKYAKDAAILEKGYMTALKNDDPIHMRYSFYCANSYKDANDKENAIKWYKNTLTLNNWTQEKYISCIKLHELYESQKMIEPQIFYALESYKYDKERVEGIFGLIKHYCIVGENDLSFSFYSLIQQYYENNYLCEQFSNKLFLHQDIYNFFLPYYMVIVSERLKKYELGLKMFDIIFTKQNVTAGEWWIKNLVFNFQFFIDKITDKSLIQKWKAYLKLIREKQYNIDETLVTKYESHNHVNDEATDE